VARTPRQTDDLLSGKEVHAVFRDYIKHEDTLVQYRITWLLVLTGMLLTTYVTLYGLMLYIIGSAPRMRADPALVDYPITMLLFVPVFLLSLIGLSASVICFRSILGASSSTKSLLAAWARFKESTYWKDSDKFLPKLVFGFSKPIGPTYGYPKTVCVVIAMLWLVSMAADVFLIGLFKLARAHLIGAA
jgi:hypothetical protein